MREEKDRWLAIEVIGEDLSKEELTKILREKFYELFGTFGVTIAPIYVLEKDQRGYFIVKTMSSGLDMIRTCCLFIKKPQINIVLVSGTLKKLREKMKKRKLWSEMQKELEKTNP